MRRGGDADPAPYGRHPRQRGARAFGGDDPEISLDIQNDGREPPGPARHAQPPMNWKRTRTSAKAGRDVGGGRIMKHLLLTGTAMLVAISAAPSAQAQSAQPGDEMNAAASNDIVVTAQRREEALQDVPIAVSVFTSAMRDKLGIRTIQDFSNNTPGLNFSATLDRLSLRGVGRLTNTIGSDPGVAVYNDGFYTASNAEASKTPMFVDRVEVLRGPQGTLYGRNSVGGALNVFSKRPRDVVEGEFRLTYERYGGVIAEGFLSGPIAGDLKARVSVQMGPRAGKEVYKNIGAGEDQGSLSRFLVEAQLQYDFSPDVQLWLKYSHAEWSNEHYGSSMLVTPYATGTPNDAGQYFTAFGPTDMASFYPTGTLVPNAAYGYTVANPGVTGKRTINNNTTNRNDLTKNHNLVANFTADMGGVTLKYVGGYSQYVYTLYNDIDLTSNGLTTGSAALQVGGGPFPVTYTYNPTYIQRYLEDKKYYSNEITLSNSNGGDVFNWIIGAYQFHERYFQPVDWFQGGDGTDDMAKAMANPVCVDQTYTASTAGGVLIYDCPSNPLRSYYSGSGLLVTDSYAGFGQADYEVSDGLRLTAGLRYSSDRKRGDEYYRLVNYNPAGGNICTFDSGSYYVFGCGPYANAVDLTRYVLQMSGTGPATRTLKDRWSGWSWRLGVDYKIDPDTLLFASYSRGLKAGGFNLGSYAESPVVDKERVDAFELGLKSRPMRGLTFNLTGFYYDYRDAQIPIVVPLTGPVALTTTNFFNIPKTRSYGIEVESNWAVTSAFDLSATYAFVDATIRRAPRLFDDPNSPGYTPVDIAGNRTPATSRHKISINALYDVPIGDAGSLFLAASYYYRSKAYYDVFESESGRAPGFDQVDARITYVDPSRRFTFIVFGRNLFNTLGYDYATGFSGTGAQGFGKSYSYTMPRQIGAEMQVKF